MTPVQEPEATTDATWWRRPGLWAAASAIGVLIGNVGGLAIGDDGVGYRAIADNLIAGHGLGYFLEPHLTIWPPGWPVLMAIVAKLTPLDTEQAAVALNALTAAVVVLLMNRLLRRLVRDPNLVLAGTAVSALGASSMVFGHLLMTDFAFVAVTLALFLALMNWRESRQPMWLGTAIVLVWAGFMVRYAGIVHIGTIGLWLLFDRDSTIVQRVRNAAIVGIGAATVPIAWIARNLATDDTALGVRYSSARGLLGNAFDTVATVGNFLTPGIEIERRTIWAAVGLVGVGVLAALTWRVVSRDRRFRSVAGIAAFLGSDIGLVVLHVCVYAAYMLYARTTTGLNRLDFRLLNPLYLPLVLCGLTVIDRVRAGAAGAAGDGSSDVASAAAWSRVAGISAAAWTALNLLVGVGMIGYFATSPDLFVGNYERPAFVTVRESRALDAIPTDCAVSSNLPNALYGSGIDAQWSPRNTGLESNDPVDDVAKLERTLERAAASGSSRRTEECLVWIDLEPNYGNLATLAQLKRTFRLQELGHDGVVTTYRIEAR